jgi:hypothetical protein
MRLSNTTRKALCVQIGDDAGRELADMLVEMARRVEALERTKVSITQIAPDPGDNLVDALPGK